MTSLLDPHQSPTVAFVTLTNLGYLDFTRNLLRSLERCDFPLPLDCYCIDEESRRRLARVHPNTFRVPGLEGDAGEGEFQRFRCGNWSAVVHQKLAVLHHALESHDFVLFLDGDIVVEKAEALEFMVASLGTRDLLVQNDFFPENPPEDLRLKEYLKEARGNDSNLCSGVMFIRSNARTRAFFHPGGVDVSTFRCDQLYLNTHRGDLSIGLLPPHRYPNGEVYYRFQRELQPDLIHFNWVEGRCAKLRKMLHHGRLFHRPWRSRTFCFAHRAWHLLGGGPVP